jgi:hypothetical protein
MLAEQSAAQGKCGLSVCYVSGLLLSVQKCFGKCCDAVSQLVMWPVHMKLVSFCWLVSCGMISMIICVILDLHMPDYVQL